MSQTTRRYQQPIPNPRLETTKIYDRPPVADNTVRPPASGEAVNDFSRAVVPCEQFELHHGYLVRDMNQRGINPADWEIVSGEEVRLDEQGMDVEFTMMRRGSDTIWRRRVNIQGGRLISITGA